MFDLRTPGVCYRFSLGELGSNFTQRCRNYAIFGLPVLPTESYMEVFYEYLGYPNVCNRSLVLRVLLRRLYPWQCAIYHNGIAIDVLMQLLYEYNIIHNF